MKSAVTNGWMKVGRGSFFRNGRRLGRRCRCKLSNSQEEGGGRTGVAYFLLQ